MSPIHNWPLVDWKLKPGPERHREDYADLDPSLLGEHNQKLKGVFNRLSESLFGWFVGGR